MRCFWGFTCGRFSTCLVLAIKPVPTRKVKKANEASSNLSMQGPQPSFSRNALNAELGHLEGKLMISGVYREILRAPYGRSTAWIRLRLFESLFEVSPMILKKVSYNLLMVPCIPRVARVARNPLNLKSTNPQTLNPSKPRPPHHTNPTP